MEGAGGGGIRRSPRRQQPQPQPQQKQPGAKPPPRRKGSFAAATASSRRHGGPATAAPPARPSSRNGGTRRPGSSGSDGSKGHASSGSGSGEKENSANGTPSKPSGGSKASSSGSSSGPGAVLSPTPYWKVLSEREGDKTSPRTTRSAAKRAHDEGLRRLNDLQDDSESDSTSDDEGRGARMVLRFEDPDQQLKEERAAFERRKREAEAHKERARKEKVRRSQFDSGSLTSGRRTAKRPKRYHGKSEQPAAPPGVSAEAMAEIMQRQLAEHNSGRIEELVAQRAAAEADAAQYKARYEEVQSKYDALEDRIKSREGSESDLQLRCVEQKGLIEGYEARIEMLEGEKSALEERRLEDKVDFSREKKMLEEKLALSVVELRDEHKLEIERLESKAAAAEDKAERKEEENASLRTAMAAKDAKIGELSHANAELYEWNEEHGSPDELCGRVAELEKIEAELTSRLEKANEVKGASGEEVTTLRAEVEAHLATIKEREGTVAKLEMELTKVTKELESTQRKMEGMQSPRSREAAAQGFADELESLEGQLATVQGEKKEVEGWVLEKEEENRALRGEVEALRAQKEALGSQLSVADGAAEEADAAALGLKVENDRLTKEAEALASKCDENETQLEEMAVENEELLAKLASTEADLRQQMRDVESEAEQRQTQMEKLLAKAEGEKVTFAEQLAKAQEDLSGLQANVATLEGDLARSQQATTALQSEKEASDTKLTELSGQLQTLTDHLEAAQSTIASLEAKLRAKDEYCENFESIERRLVEEKRALHEVRRELHNRVIQLSGNIRVFVRVRPLIESERALAIESERQPPPPPAANRRHTLGRPSSANGRPSSRGSMGPGGRPSSRGSLASSSSHRPLLTQGEESTEQCPFHFPSLTDRKTDPSTSSPNYTSFHDLTKQTIELTEPYKDRGGLNPRRKKWKYGFDRVFNQGDGQEDVWAGAEPLVQSAVDGFHVCMFAYGQTGSGKTHTMIGDAQNQGLIPRAVEKLFTAKKEIEQCRGGATVDIRVELLEIYNEEVRDLLDDNAGPDGQLIKLKLSSNEAVGNIKVNARDEQEVEGILKLAQERRCVKATKSNAESSRSHLLFTIHFDVSSNSNDGAANRNGCLHIIDLAGSERLDKSGSHGALLTEAKHINTSLSALALVIEKLQAKKLPSEHIPYRDSKLTYLLRNSLGGDSKTLAIVCCSPHQAHFNESLNSIRFAAKASKVELKEANKVDV